ncbi:hypothetical protein JTE90_027859 [Oedothorax gibbosus]|uniref:Uncharacterized protein n=1 Tax=Oedothorax gibbosus TaxID=931172 RepID=A0AAV6U7P4_9ARAC|nr:hypothetical protein JTE90_027859 [Oedothorax gibbosus]
MDSSSEQPEPPKSPCLIVKAVLLVFSMICATFGLFFFAYNLHGRAVYSSQTLAVVCGLYMHQVYLSTKGKLLELYSFRRFKAIFIVGVVVGVIQLLATVSYAILGLFYHQRFYINHGFYVGAIPSSMACCWAFLLAYESKRHMKEVGPDVDDRIPHIIQ